MKKAIFLAALFFAASLSCTTWIVNNMPDTDPDFTSISDAIIDVRVDNGDTLYVCGSNTPYAGFELNKSLTIIGTGFFLTENPHTQAFPCSSYINGQINFVFGSAGSVLTGVMVRNININADNITIKRNYLYVASDPCDLIMINSGVHYLYIIQNYLYNSSIYGNCWLIYAAGMNDPLYISNNIFVNKTNNTLGISSTSSATIENNVFYAESGAGTVSIYYTVFQNNIMRSGTFYNIYGNEVNYNIGNNNQFGTEDGNQNVSDMSTVFALTGSTDGIYHLASGSPAIGAGTDGDDCGCYGGQEPYVLSGMPDGVPSIYDFNSPGSGFSFPVQIKAHSH